MKKQWVLIKLFVLSVLGKNEKKADVIKKANIYRRFEGGTTIQAGFLPILN